MFEGETAYVLYYSLFLILIGGVVVREFRRKPGQSVGMAGVWIAIFAAVVLVAEGWDRFNGPAQSQSVNNQGNIELTAGRGGHFHVTAQLNGTPVEFIVDTGATTIALAQNDAERIGFDTDNLAYLGRANTANGVVETANVTIDEFAIEDMLDRNVGATVVAGDLNTSLLGMTYLRRFASVSFQGDKLILER